MVGSGKGTTRRTELADDEAEGVAVLEERTDGN